MKVNTDIAGNYSPQSIRQKPESVQQERKIKNSRDEEKFGAPDKEKIKTGKNISEEEKNFFAEMYPLNKNEIMEYHYYQKTGKPSGISLGSLFDKKG
jgi:hypothetical protein